MSRPLVLLAAGGYGELVQNLRTKWMEGWLRPLPPLWDGHAARDDYAYSGLSSRVVAATPRSLPVRAHLLAVRLGGRQPPRAREGQLAGYETSAGFAIPLDDHATYEPSLRRCRI